MDGLVLNPRGFTAVHTTRTLLGDCSTTPCPNREQNQTEQIIANDSTGVQVLDTAVSQYSVAQRGTPLLTNLKLSGDTLTWSHAGTTKSVQLR